MPTVISVKERVSTAEAQKGVKAGISVERKQRNLTGEFWPARVLKRNQNIDEKRLQFSLTGQCQRC